MKKRNKKNYNITNGWKIKNQELVGIQDTLIKSFQERMDV